MNGMVRRLLGDRLSERIARATMLVTLCTALLIGAGAGTVVHRIQAGAQTSFIDQLTTSQAQRLGERLTSILDRLQQAAQSSLIATALVDSAGKELYLEPFLRQLAFVRGVPVAIGFFDFEGKPIASSFGAPFDREQLDWVEQGIQRQRDAATIIGHARDAQILILSLVQYNRTAAPEGAIVARVRLSDLISDPGCRATWVGMAGNDGPGSLPVPADPIFTPLSLRLSRVDDQPRPVPGDYSILLVAAIVVVACAFAVVAGRRIATRLTADIDRLADSTRRLDASRLLTSDMSVPESSTPEVAMISKAMNDLLLGVTNAHRNHVAAEQARAAQALADESSRQKSILMSRVSHELRTPLNAIQGFADLLIHEGGLTADQRDGLGHIATASRRLLALVDDLLEISGLESGALRVRLVDLSLLAVMESVSKRLEHLANQHGVEVRIVDVPNSLRVRADPVRLQQVVQLLVTNAIKFNVQGGVVELSASKRGEQVDLVVRDSGGGLDAQQLAQIFQPFNGAGREDGQIEGTGLGLTLCRALVTCMNGEISVQSRPGQGTSVKVALLRAPSPPAHLQA